MALFFHMICLGWLVFRAQSVAQIFDMLSSLIFNFDVVRGFGLGVTFKTIILTLWFLLIIQYFQFSKRDLLIIFRQNWLLRGILYYIIVFLLVVFGAGGEKEFIYFQF